MLRSWTISIFIFFLTVIWLVPVLFLAGLLNTKSIRQVWPKLADALDGNKTAKTLMQNFVPTAFLTLLNIAVPYLYDCELCYIISLLVERNTDIITIDLSNLQGMLSQSDVELSVISKNFFFTFFNLFLAFSVL